MWIPFPIVNNLADEAPENLKISAFKFKGLFLNYLTLSYKG